MSIRNVLALLAVTLSAAIFPAYAADILIKDAWIVDPAAETIKPGSIVITGERIAQVLDKAPPDFDGEVLDAGGAFVIPGFYDLHVHFGFNRSARSRPARLTNRRNANLMLFAGIAGFLDLTIGGEERHFGLRAALRSGVLLGPTAFVSGGVTAPFGHGTQFGVASREVETVEEAMREISDLVLRRQPDIVKMQYEPYSRPFPSLQLDVLRAVLRGARKAGIKTVVAAPSWRAALEAVEAGASAITEVPSGSMPTSMIEALKQRGTVWIPALSVHTGLADFFENEDLLSRPLFVAVSEGLGRAYKSKASLPSYTRRVLAGQRQKRLTHLESVRAAARAGVPIAAGTDAGSPGTFHGYSIHHEMALLVEAGLTPWEALRSATTTAGEFLGVPVGVRSGDLASLVLLSESPIENIENTEKIVAMIHRVQRLSRLQRLGPRLEGAGHVGESSGQTTPCEPLHQGREPA